MRGGAAAIPRAVTAGCNSGVLRAEMRYVAVVSREREREQGIECGCRSRDFRDFVCSYTIACNFDEAVVIIL